MAADAEYLSIQTFLTVKMPNQYIKNAEGQFICPHCDYTARIQSTMHYHLKKHEGALPHACKHCDSKFLQKNLLELHIRSRHKETIKSQETFKCPCNDCDYEDMRKGNRLIHFVRVHLKDLTEALKNKTDAEGCITSCSCCNKSFKSMTQFYYHAAGCVKPTQNHDYYSSWEQIHAV
jgi:hypothetical protein